MRNLFMVYIYRALNFFDFLFEKIAIFIFCFRLIPHAIYFFFTKNDCDIRKDIEIWKKYYNYIDWRGSDLRAFVRMMRTYPEFRNVFYYRINCRRGGLFETLCPPMSTLYLYAEKIGPGLFISHGFASIVAAKSIGKNFYLHQQVTIGWRNDDNPIIGDNVQIGAGAIVIGGIKIGNNSIVGAGATVTKNVEEYAIVVGNPAYQLPNK